MRIMLDIPDELAAVAMANGVEVEAYLERLLRQVAPPVTAAKDRSRERIETFLAEMAKGSDRLPKLPTESFTRESFYER